MVSQPQQPSQPPVTDPDNVPENLCDGLFNVSVAGPLAILTFTHVRPQPGPLFAIGTITPEAIVRARIVTTIPNLVALRDLLNTIVQSVSTADVSPAPATGGTTRH